MLTKGMRRLLLLALSVEIAGIGVISVGIAYEVEYGANLGLIAITVGSVVVAAGGIIWGKFGRLMR